MVIFNIFLLMTLSFGWAVLQVPWAILEVQVMLQVYRGQYWKFFLQNWAAAGK